MIPKPPDSYMLRNLREVQLPDVVSWYPQTIGWKILLAVVLCFIAYKTYRYVKNWWQNRYRKEAVEALMAVSVDDPNWPYRLLNIIKIVMVYLNTQNASLYGNALLVKMDDYDTNNLDFSGDSSTAQWLLCVESCKYSQPEFEYIRSRLVQWVNVHQIEDGDAHE